MPRADLHAYAKGQFQYARSWFEVRSALETLLGNRPGGAFRENDVDAEVLCDLTAEDLMGVGIASIGHHSKLLAPIAARQAGGVRSVGTSSRSAPTVSEPEHRQVTVMFVDLVDSMALGSTLDPEEMRERLRAFRNAVAAAIERFYGHVAKYMGDGVLACFGYPKPTRMNQSVRSGLDWPPRRRRC